MVLLDELGIGTAGRGQDLNQILLRANPTLASPARPSAILTRQGAQLQAVISATRTIMAQGAAHTAALKRFLVSAAALSANVAGHRGPARDARSTGSPGSSAATRPALQQVDAVARSGTPLLNQLHASAPWLDRVSTDLGPFAAAAGPALGPDDGGAAPRAPRRSGSPCRWLDAITAYTEPLEGQHAPDQPALPEPPAPRVRRELLLGHVLHRGLAAHGSTRPRTCCRCSW